MPFTFFHPAAVVPLLRVRVLVPAGLVIGAMSPDFEYFLRLNTVARHTHTWPGLVYACVPLGLVALVAWQAVIREPLVGALPGVIRTRVGGLASSGVPSTAGAWALAALSVLVGAATHLLWDSFTHPGYLPAQRLGLDAVSPVLGLPWTSVLQRSSDLVGLGVLALVIARLPRRPVPAGAHRRLFWLVTTLTAVVLVGLRSWLQPGWQTLSTVIATTIAGVLLGVLVAAVATRTRTPESSPPGSDPRG